MKKIIILLVSMFLFTSSPLVFAEKSINIDKTVIDEVNTYISIISQNTENWENAKAKYEFPLYDFDGNITSFLFTVEEKGEDKGYIIISNTSQPEVLESTREGSHPYINKKKNEEKAVYVGPTMHYVEQEDNASYLDLRSEKVINKRSLKSKGSLSKGFTNKEQNEPQIGIQTIISYSSKILNVADMAWYIGCSPTSFGNIVRYWDSNGYPNLVQSTTTDKTLIEVLATNMNTDRSSGKTDWNDRVTGMINFWDQKGYSVSVSRVSDSYSTHKTEINNNRPNIINVVNDPTYENHDMTGVGYEEYQVPEENFKWYRFVIVHDTWPSTNKNIYLNLSNFSSWNEIVTVKPN
ncbi:MAG TPA: hypothetical protein GXX18_14935 [Bacillales bacterium]|nr:hypothetical protein [Bacillales bacterium]